MRKNFLIFFIITKNIYLFSSEIFLDAIKYADKESFFLPSDIIITQKDIEKLSPKNFSELLKMYNVDIYSRSDMQQDVSLNGGSFEQIKILLNGVVLNDPQTGHHSFNIPLNLKNIDYIQIIKSDNFSKYGNNAFSGVINIVTKKYNSNNISLSYGSFNTFSFSGVSYEDNKNLSFDLCSSDGYRENTDYTYYNLYGSLDYKNLSFLLGFLNKDFGAQDFYALNRKEYEQTQTFFTNINYKSNLKRNLKIDFNIFLRAGYDYYTTQRDYPEIYRNRHNSYVYGTTTKIDFIYTRSLKIQPGIEVVYKNLDSKGESKLYPSWRGMGIFYDEEKTIFTNIVFDKNKFSSETSFRINYFSRYNYLSQFGQKFVFKPKFNIETFANISKVYRIPSYTELFYWDPNHQSQEDLKIEQTMNYSAGVGFKINKNIGFSLSGSYYEPTNSIDWARESGTSSWKVTNIAKLETYVLDFKFNFNYKFINSKLIYTFVNKKFDLPQNIELKYIDNYPTNSLSFLLFLPPVIGFETSVNNIYKKYTKTNPEEYLITNLTISKKFFENLEVVLGIENLFNNKYEEIPAIQQSPQRILFKLQTTF